MSESYYFGQGKLWIAEILASGALGPWVWLGDVSELTGQGNETRVQHRESFSGVNAMVRDFGKEAGMTWNATMHQLDADNVGRFTRSRMSAQIAGTVTGEQLPDSVEDGDLITLDHMNVTDLVLTDSLTPTPATLVRGTHYDHDIFGDLEILTLPTSPVPTQPLVAAYSHGATKQAAFLAGTDKNYALKYKGINLAENGAPILVELYKTSASLLQQLSLITTGNQLASSPVSFTTLLDSSKPASGDLGQFGRFVEMAA
ncbi:phage tail tube protein [Stutzerimonas nitrititolerans]|uniref:phage tail tube protein n=1 Tax=Stutzerimonas nitrititolerans TaxID=2482751 RepID=UPI00289C2942|nr:hypothetical protein [Stutzerimonas nitrititolerans]